MATFKMQLNNLEETLLNIEAYLEAECDDADDESKYKVMLIAEELLTNLVRHADFEDKTPFITFDIKLNEKNIFQLECRDNSKAFNLLEQKNPNIHADLQKKEPGGLGIYLLKKYAQELEYIYKDGLNILRLSV